MFKHGDRKTRLYNIWKKMKSRVKGTSDSRKKHLYVHVQYEPAWEAYEPFRDWALLSGYRDDLTIDRIDPRGDYTPSNCRWATYSQQNMNTRSRSHKSKTSLFKGVSLDRNHKRQWRACYQLNGKGFHVGNFHTQLEAALAYDKAVGIAYGEFARLNFAPASTNGRLA